MAAATSAEIEIANKVLDALVSQAGRSAKWVGSSWIINEGGVSVNLRPRILQTLHALAALPNAIVQKYTSGKKLYWRVESTSVTWNRSNPFVPAGGSVVTHTPRGGDFKQDWPSFTGNTYSHRIIFGRYGAKFEKEGVGNGRWYVHPNHSEEVRNLNLSGVIYHPSRAISGEPGCEPTGLPEPQDPYAGSEPEPSQDPTGDFEKDRLHLKITELHQVINELKVERDGYLGNLAEQGDQLKALEKAKKEIEANKDRKNITLTIKKYDGLKKVHKNITLPKVFEEIRQLAEQRRNILLVGPAGCGKTYLARLIADSLMLPFSAVNCTAGMTEAHLLGRSIPNLTTGKSVFETTAFLKCYEQGGVALLDELDAGDSNMLLCLNTGLDNGYLNVPSRANSPEAVQHKDFICIATANTFGRGSSREYAGRNQLDGATIGRFQIGTVEMDYDPVIEMEVCPCDTLRTLLQQIRNKCEENNVRRNVSTRFMRDAWIMKEKAGWTETKVIQTLISGWTEDEVRRADVRDFAGTDNAA